MAYTAETSFGYEPPLSEIMNSKITRMVMDSDNVPLSHVEELTRRAAENVRKHKGR